jgi:hypothetical protein
MVLRVTFFRCFFCQNIKLETIASNTRKYSHNIENEYLQKSALFIFQLILHYVMLMESLIGFAVETTVIDKNQVFKLK